MNPWKKNKEDSQCDYHNKEQVTFYLIVIIITSVLFKRNLIIFEMKV